jgi:hypothetical protein
MSASTTASAPTRRISLHSAADLLNLTPAALRVPEGHPTRRPPQRDTRGHRNPSTPQHHVPGAPEGTALRAADRPPSRPG